MHRVMKRENSRWTPKLEAQALAKHDAGRTIRSIAADYGITPKRMGIVLQRAAEARSSEAAVQTNLQEGSQVNRDDRIKERGLLMSAPMVRSLLRDVDPKMQTRRIVKGQTEAWQSVGAEEDTKGREFFFVFGTVEKSGEHAGLAPIVDSIRCPYGQAGDRLWIREHWRVSPTVNALPPRDIPPRDRIWYEADGKSGITFGRFRHGMFMPRWASRITLEITDVRVERLNDVSEEDAIAEGLQRASDGFAWHVEDERHRATLASESYASLWETINGAGSWDANPWVFAITFRRLS